MPLILGTNSIKDTGFDVANSLRFNSGSNQFFEKVMGTPTSTKIGTFSCWVKLGNITTEQTMLGAYADSNNRHHIEFQADHNIEIFGKASGSTNMELITNAYYRDPSAWQNIVVAYDTSQGTASNRVKLYVNGTQVTSFATETYPSQDTVLQFNTNGSTHTVGRNKGGNYADGYMCEVVFIDGQQLTPTSFGEFDSDSPTIWKPIDVSGLTGGNIGFYLDFEDGSNLGNDVFGGTDFDETNITSTNQSTDTCTLNMTTANPLHFNATIPSAGTLSDGNLTFTSSQGSSAYPAMYSTMAVSQGKWYAEFKVTTGNSAIVGIGAGSLRGGFFGGGYYDYAYYYDGTFYNNGGNTGSQSSYTDGDIISVAMDLDNNKVYVAKNNTWQHSGNPSAGSGGYTITAPSSTNTGVYHFAYGDAGGGTPAIQGNFGSPPYSSNGNSDANDYGNMTYSVPTGFFILNSKNLAEYG